MNYVITIGRQIGSGGKQVGKLLSQHLHIPCYDKELIGLASQKSGLGKEFFEKFDEKNSHNFFDAFFGFESNYMGDNSENYLCNEQLFKIQSDVIQSLAAKESCIFVGRCSNYILRNHPHCFNVFISAEKNDRIQRIMQIQNINKKDALSLIEQTDKNRANYCNYYSNKVWGMAASYDLCVNSSIFNIEKIIAIIEEYVIEHYSMFSI